MSAKLIGRLFALVIGVVTLAGLYATRSQWGATVARRLTAAASWLDPSRGEQSHDHALGAPKGAADARIELSEQAQQNIGLETTDLQAATFTRTITVPGIVAEKPGHSDIEVTAPVKGVVTQVFPLRGETIEPGDPIFHLRLTHEELVQAQLDLLKTTEELGVVVRELARMAKIIETPIRAIVEKEYEQQKLEAIQRAQQQALVLHGLSDAQVQGILNDRRLLKEVLIFSPSAEPERMDRKTDHGTAAGEPRTAPNSAELAAPPSVLQAAESKTQQPKHSDLGPRRPWRFMEMENLFVERGQHVDVGKPLCRLGDHASLYVEGRAFEHEAPLLTAALSQSWKVSASFETGTARPEVVSDLNIVYLSNSVERESRAFPFYVELPNEIVRDARTPEGHRFITWKYKPGQRVQLHVPVEQWPNRLVVPADAVVQEGAETFVFQRNGDLFERRTVHVEYQDQRSAVLANDGSVFPGEAIVVRGAFQLHLAIKNQTGGGIDPHAGHQH